MDQKLDKELKNITIIYILLQVSCEIVTQKRTMLAVDQKVGTSGLSAFSEDIESFNTDNI